MSLGAFSLPALTNGSVSINTQTKSLERLSRSKGQLCGEYKALIHKIDLLDALLKERISEAKNYSDSCDMFNCFCFPGSDDDYQFVLRYYLQVKEKAYHALELFDRYARDSKLVKKEDIEKGITDLEKLATQYQATDGSYQPLPERYQCQKLKGAIFAIVGLLAAYLATHLLFNGGFSDKTALEYGAFFGSPIGGIVTGSIAVGLLYKSYSCFFPPKITVKSEISEVVSALRKCGVTG